MRRDTILVTGSRNWRETAYDTMRRWLELVSGVYGCTRLVHGGARGADEMAGRIAQELELEVVTYPVDCSIDGPWPGAGHARNRRMVNAEALRVAVAYAFNWQHREISPGTASCIVAMCNEHIPVTVISPGTYPLITAATDARQWRNEE